MTITHKQIFHTLLFLCCFTKAFSQDAATENKPFQRSVWGAVGLGQSSLGSFAGLATFNAEVADHFVLSAGATSETDAVAFINTQVDTYNLLGGTVLKQKHLLFSISGGIGVANTSTYSRAYTSNSFDPETTQVKNSTICFPIIAQCYFVPVGGFGVGLGGYVELNSVKTTEGFTISIAFGHLGTRRL